MVTQFGMSDLGPVSFSEEEETVFLGREVTRTHNQSNETLQRIDAAIQRISRECYEQAAKLLADNRPKLEKLAKALIRHETLSAEEVELVLNDGDVEKYRSAHGTSRDPRKGAEATAEGRRGEDALPGLDRGTAPGLA
jgi:cell division protease FtsH